MFRFITGVIVGLGAAWLLRSKYMADLGVEQRMSEIQKKSDAILTESRHILQETRKELMAAAEAGRQSLQHKADRMKTAVEHPEEIEQEHAQERAKEGEARPTGREESKTRSMENE
ncbi:MAG: hypothetical protein M1325_03355 [Actinobacteria bacterium]|nr:hypothetical protein [Actinomycetota bacterium]